MSQPAETPAADADRMLPAWERIRLCRYATEDTLFELLRTLHYCYRQGDRRLSYDLAPSVAALRAAIEELDAYLSLIGKLPPGSGSEVSTGSTDVPERDSGGSGDGGSGGGGGGVPTLGGGSYP